MKKFHVILMLLVALTISMPATLTLAAADSSKSQTQEVAGKININTANETVLVQVPGIGPKTAQKIVAYREKNGKFKTLDELTSVKGIGEKSFGKMKSYLTL